jgi:translation initiation factor IF-3
VPVRRFSARINDQIDAQSVLLIGWDGDQLGVMPAERAREYAYARDLDLVEVAAQAEPPVCRAMDYGKWRYEEERQARQSRRNQVEVSFKEVRLRPKIGAHDYTWKKQQLTRFLQQRAKVKLVVLFRGRERAYPERGAVLIERLAEDVKELGELEGKAVFEGRSMTAVIAPKAVRST